MRWKLYGDERENQYKCCWFIHVRTGTVLLGIYSLVNQVVGLLLLSYILSHPSVVPDWLSSFEVSRLGVPQSGVSICDHAGMRHKRHAGGMMDPMPMMGGPMMHGHGPMHGNGPMMDGPMMHGGLLPDDDSQDVSKKKKAPADSDDVKVLPRIDDIMLPKQMMPQVGNMMPEYITKKAPADSDDVKVLPRIDNIMLPKQMMPEVGNMMPDYRDSVGVQLADVLSKPDDKISSNHDDEDDDRDLIIPVGSKTHDIFRLRNQVDFASGSLGLTADDTFFTYAMMICCILASVLLITGVIKGRPGHMIPFMGLQAFDFCASALFVFAIFSYLPYLRNFLLSLPDSFPYKCDLLAMKTDRLMLAIILLAVCTLVTKAYLMGIVWSCYKYLTQANQTRGRHRSLDSDAARSPEDAELLLPPKYEDIANAPSEDVESPPPAYATG